MDKHNMRADEQPKIKTIFEKNLDHTGGRWCIDEFSDYILAENTLKNLPLREKSLALVSLPEVEVTRHFTELSRASHGVDNGSYPLGSCTMKYNPKSHERLANLDGFKSVHPLQPLHTLSGLAEMFFNLQNHIAEITGVDFVSLQPAAGAHGELTGLLVIRKHFETKNENRKIILIADSAHGTNPSSAAMVGFNCRIIPTTDDGLMDIAALKNELNENVAALMLTNPSTLGLFEENILEIAELTHACGALLYYDGANMNALMGISRPGDMGFDVVHINTHKTLSTPHGGGGPGAGPVGVKAFLKNYLPVPVAVKTHNEKTNSGEYTFEYDRPETIGKVKTHFGHVLVLIKAYAYILAMGPQGLKEASENAVLNANYIMHQLAEKFPPAFDKICMHECLLSGKSLPVSIYSFAKRLIDHGVHPPTLVGAGCVYYPDKFKQTMLIEPTETETKENLDQMISSFLAVHAEALEDKDYVELAPYSKKTNKVPEKANIFTENTKE
ncbi:MAG: aminomethyl-transferring glycine dehydrogenase subunit GcvPB, partial [Bdellovibrionales bacterium]